MNFNAVRFGISTSCVDMFVSYSLTWVPLWHHRQLLLLRESWTAWPWGSTVFLNCLHTNSGTWDTMTTTCNPFTNPLNQFCWTTSTIPALHSNCSSKTHFFPNTTHKFSAFGTIFKQKISCFHKEHTAIQICTLTRHTVLQLAIRALA